MNALAWFLGRVVDALGRVEPGPPSPARPQVQPPPRAARSLAAPLWVGAGSWAGVHERTGSPNAIRELLDGLADVLVSEVASAAVRGDQENAMLLNFLEEQVRDVCDQIRD